MPSIAPNALMKSPRMPPCPPTYAVARPAGCPPRRGSRRPPSWICSPSGRRDRHDDLGGLPSAEYAAADRGRASTFATWRSSAGRRCLPCRRRSGRRGARRPRWRQRLPAGELRNSSSTRWTRRWSAGRTRCRSSAPRPAGPRTSPSGPPTKSQSRTTTSGSSQPPARPAGVAGCGCGVAGACAIADLPRPAPATHRGRTRGSTSPPHPGAPARRPAAAGGVARAVADLNFSTVGFGDDAVDYLAAWDLQREVHAAVVAGGRTPCCCSSTRRSSPPASAPSRTSGRRPTAPRSSTSTAAARSPSTAPASWSATRSCGCPTTCKVVDYVRRIEEALIAVCADLGVTTARVPGPQRRLARRADDRGPSARSPRSASGSAAASTMHGFALNCDVDLALVRPVRALRHRRRRRHLAEPRSSAATSPSHEVLPLVERHLARPAGLGAVRRRPRTTSRARSRPRSPR